MTVQWRRAEGEDLFADAIAALQAAYGLSPSQVASGAARRRGPQG
jgi:hypothetical protein